MRIPVIFTPDGNYMLQTSVVIYSMMVSKSYTTAYDFYILVSEKTDKSTFSYIECLRNIFQDIRIEFVLFDSKYWDEKKINTPHITTSAYYRLILSDIFSFDKCMYHDGDILVFDDLSDMYNVNIDNVYVAGVKAIALHQDNINNNVYQQRLKIPSMNQYIIDSDMVLNLKKIRIDGITDRFKEEALKGYPQQDQDIINIVCYDNIYFLDLRYGLLNRWAYNHELYKFKKQIYREEEIEKAICNPAIVHFAGGVVKPWVNIRTAYANEWWEIAKKILSNEEYESWHNHVEQLTSQRDFKTLLDSLNKDADIYIFGCGKIGKEIYNVLVANDVEICAFLDNNVEDYSDGYLGQSVILPKSIKNEKECQIIISSSIYRKEMLTQLKAYGLDRYVIDYEFKTDLYYMSLSPEYYEIEYRDLMMGYYGTNAIDKSIDELKEMDSDNHWKKIWR